MSFPNPIYDTMSSAVDRSFVTYNAQCLPLWNFGPGCNWECAIKPTDNKHTFKLTYANHICSLELLIRFKFLQVKQAPLAHDVPSLVARFLLHNSCNTKVSDLWQIQAWKQTRTWALQISKEWIAWIFLYICMHVGGCRFIILI